MLAQRREPEACRYILKIASLYRDWPEKLLGDVKTEGLTSLLVSTYDGNLQAIKNLIENAYADLYCRISALHVFLGLFATGKLSREEVIDYYRYLLRSPLVMDNEFASFLVCDIHDFFPQELYDDVMLLFESGCIDAFLIRRVDFQKALNANREEHLREHMYTYKFYLPVDDVVSEVAWLYRPAYQEVQNSQKKSNHWS